MRFQKKGDFDYLDWRVVSFGVIAVDLLSFKYLHLILPFTLAAGAWVCSVAAGRNMRPAIAWMRGRWQQG